MFPLKVNTLLVTKNSNVIDMGQTEAPLLEIFLNLFTILKP